MYKLWILLLLFYFILGETGGKIEKRPQTMITKVPEGDDFLKPCNHQLDRDTETPKVKANLNHLRMVCYSYEYMVLQKRSIIESSFRY